MQIPLPPTAQVVADVIGREATLLLASKCQYRHLSIPRGGIPSGSWIVREIGEKKAAALVAAFGGELLPLATCYHVHQAERDEAIRAANAAGKGITEIAETWRMSRTNVARILDVERAERNRRRTRQRMRQLREGGQIGGAIVTPDGGRGEGAQKLAGDL